MGNCKSIPDVEGSGLAELRASAWARAASFSVGGKHAPNGAARTGSADMRLAILQKVNGLQQQLALVHANPLLRLPEAAELLAAQLEADLVAIWVVTKDDPSTSVLMASHGKGVSALRGCIVVRPPAEDQEVSGISVGAACSLNVPDVTAAGASIEPAELWQGPAGLRSFVQVPIGTASNPLGVLLLAKSQPNFFNGPWWHVQLRLAATGLLPHVRQGPVERMADLLRRMEITEDGFQLVGALLRGASEFMLKSCTLQANARLALLQPRGCPDALLFEAPCPFMSSASNSRHVRRDADASTVSEVASEVSEFEDKEVVASMLRVSNTLLGAAVAQRQARFVSDVGLYMQCCPRPARDIFTRSSRLVSSIVVVPLIAGDAAPLGGLYFCLDSPCEFANIQDTLLGFIHGVAPMLHKKLSGKSEQLAAAVQQAHRNRSHSNASLPMAPPSEAGGMELGGTSTFSSSSGSADPHGTNALSLAPSSLAPSTAVTGQTGPPSLTPSGRLPTISSSQRLNTEAMLQLLQRDIRSKNGRHDGADQSRAAEVAVGECLGRAGCGAVFRGTWHRVPVAVKVMATRNEEAAALQDAVEMAVLSSVQHPNIVQVFACLTDMVKASNDYMGGRSASFTGGVKTHYRRLRAEEDPDEAVTYNLIVMEPCDRGTLRDAIGNGLLHQSLPDGAIGIKLAPAAELLLDVAYAVQYLHSMQLVHGDLRLENVLLKTDRARPLGATPKLAEFGLTRILNDADHAVAAAPAGSAAHIAPEMFRSGGQVSTAVDAYAFGVFMWEVYTSKKAFSGLPREAVIERVTTKGSRPRFPSTTPAAFVELAQACWAADPAARPNFTQIAEALDRMVAELSGRPI